MQKIIMDRFRRLEDENRNIRRQLNNGSQDLPYVFPDSREAFWDDVINRTTNIPGVLDVDDFDHRTTNFHGVFDVNDFNHQTTNISGMLNVDDSNHTAKIPDVFNVDDSDHTTNISGLLSIDDSDRRVTNIPGALEVDDFDHTTNFPGILDISDRSVLGEDGFDLTSEDSHVLDPNYLIPSVTDDVFSTYNSALTSHSVGSLSGYCDVNERTNGLFSSAVADSVYENSTPAEAGTTTISAALDEDDIDSVSPSVESFLDYGDASQRAYGLFNSAVVDRVSKSNSTLVEVSVFLHIHHYCCYQDHRHHHHYHCHHHHSSCTSQDWLKLRLG